MCRFAVISDLHYYDTSLGDTGAAFRRDIDNDPKLLEKSGDILNTAVNNLLSSNVPFVLVSGDLTKDGEKQNHKYVAAELKRLTDKGIKVYVVPGNHDVNNPQSFSYRGNTTKHVPSVTKDEFAQIYSGCGYSDAIFCDSGSLSYITEPVPGLWLACMDSCRYYDNKPGQIETVGGKFTPAEEAWLAGILKKAESSGKAVMLMMHHGLVEHWEGQSRLDPNSLVEDYKLISEMLASYNVRLVFTGHYHAQDIAKTTFGGRDFVYDVETGSLVTGLCPVRYCVIDTSQNFTYRTVRIAEKMYQGKTYGRYANFMQYAIAKQKKPIVKTSYKTLCGLGINEKDAQTIADCISDAYAAHYAGNEDVSQRPALDINKLAPLSRDIFSRQQYIIDGLWNDLSVKQDNNGSFSVAAIPLFQAHTPSLSIRRPRQLVHLIFELLSLHLYTSIQTNRHYLCCYRSA